MKALLATPHGKGVYWMLLQHHRYVGTKSIDFMAIFKSTVSTS